MCTSAFATVISVHRFGAFFRFFMDKPRKPGDKRAHDVTNFDDRWSDSARIRGSPVSTTRTTHYGQNSQANRDEQTFSLSHFPLPIQYVSIRSVSTKLKVNSGRTNPPGRSSQRKTPSNKRDRPPRWFPGKSCANTASANAKGVARLTYSDRTSLQIDQDLHPGPRTFALDVLPALLSTYLPAQARQLISASNWLLCSSRVLRSINGDRRYWNVLTLHGSYPCHMQEHQ